MSFIPRLNHGVKHMVPDVIVASSKGSYVFTECGRNFLDFTCGIGVTNLGHSHPRVTDAVKKGAETIVHAQQNIMRHRPMVNLIDKLASLDLPTKAGLDSWFFWNSGAEAVEAAVKIARQSTGRPNIIGANLGYHGRTYGTMALTTSGTIYRSGFGPVMGGTFVMPFPYMTQSPYSLDGEHRKWTFSTKQYWGNAPVDISEKETKRCLSALELTLRTQTSPSETAGIILEPVMGEGGYVPAPPGFLQGVREICDKHNIMLIADEVQTGFGRTGSMFACDWIDGGIKPDILICAKGLANGYPLSAVATRSEISARQPPGSMGGTYGANAIGCAASLAVLEAFEQENVLENSLAREQEIRQHLNAIASEFPSFMREVRGRGLMIGIELEPLKNLAPGYTASAVVTACHRRGLLILSCGPYETLRFIPPLNVSSEDVAKGMGIFREAMKEVWISNQ